MIRLEERQKYDFPRLRPFYPEHAVLCFLLARKASARPSENAAGRKDAVYENLRDLSFEYKAGKFPESDYQAMKMSLEEEAAMILAEIARLEAGALSSATSK